MSETRTPLTWAHVDKWQESDDTYDAWLEACVLAESLERKAAHFDALREALQPFARFFCAPPGYCQCHNCHARDVLAAADEIGGD